MARYLRQSTAATIVLGPFVDDTDGKTAETALTISASDVQISKNGAAFGAANAAATHMANGYYSDVLSTGNTDTVGRLTVTVNEAGALPVRHDYIVLPAVQYDALVGGTDNFDVSVTQIAGAAVSATTAQLGVNIVQVSGDAAAADNLEADYDGTGYAKPASTVGGVTGDVSGTVGGVAGTITSFDGLVTAKDDDWSGLPSIETGTLQSATSTTAVLDDAPTTIIASGDRNDDDYLNRAILLITGGTGAGQQRRILDYTGSSFTATVRAWGVTPASDSTYEILPDDENTVSEIQTDILSRLPTSLVSGRIDASVGAMAANVLTDAATSTDMDVYQARVYLFDDDTGTTDRYVAIWHKNGAPVTSGITSPLIQVYAVANGADLIASTAMTQIASTGTYRYNASGAERTTAGAAYIAKVTATIDGAARDTYVPVGRDT